ncbi:MAG: hypothetical protein ACXWSC_20995 [Bdellovibrionota bacterium]
MTKKLLPILCAAATALALASTSFAGYKGSVSFTDLDRANHLRVLPTIMDTAARCLSADLAKHNAFIKRFGISAFYGDNSSFSRNLVQNPDGTTTKVPTTPEQKRAVLRSMGAQENLVQALVPQKQCFTVDENPVPKEIPANKAYCQYAMEPTSCIGLSLKCLGQGFAAAHEDDLWQTILNFTLDNDVQGDALQVALQQLGWKLTYWNPDTTAAARWDQQEQQQYPNDPGHIWGQHVDTLAAVMGPRHKYLFETVDDWTTLVDFGHSEPDAIKRVPFFVGIAHLGYHVFPGTYGQIIEGHSTRQVNDPDSIQTSPFNPLVVGGGPRGGPYKSGLIAIPPGY